MTAIDVPRDVEAGDIIVRDDPKLTRSFIVFDAVEHHQVDYYEGQFETAGGVLSRFGISYRTEKEPDDVEVDGFTFATEEERETVIQVVENIADFLSDPTG